MQPHPSPPPEAPLSDCLTPGPLPLNSLPPGGFPILSAEWIAAGVRAREVLAVDVVAAALARIERAEPTLCAFVEVWAEEALRRAAEVDEQIAAGVRLPLAGVPIGVKGRSGLRTASARALVAAGCVPVGATSVPGPGTPWQTWGLGADGRTVNPWRADRTPGGSSAGSAAAVAAGLVPMATGTDGAGSVRIPAAWCGVVGLKTTNGRLPSADRTGLAAAGVLTRYASDAAAYWRCVAAVGEAQGAEDTRGGGAERDGHEKPDTTGETGPTAPTDASRATRAVGATEPTGARGATGATESTGARGTAEPTGTRGATRAAGSARTTGRTGAAMTARAAADVPPPVIAVWSPDLGFAGTDPEPAAIAHRAALRLADTGLVRLTGLLGLTGLVRPPVRQESAPLRQENPPSPETNPQAQWTNPLRLEDPGPAWLALRAAPDSDPATLRAAQELRAENDRRLAALFAGADLILTPTTPNAPHGHAGPGERYSTALTWAFNLSGHPAMSIPAGFGSDGCPVGLHLVARHGEEDLLLRVARAAEAARTYPHPEHRAYPGREQETPA